MQETKGTPGRADRATKPKTTAPKKCAACVLPQPKTENEIGSENENGRAYSAFWLAGAQLDCRAWLLKDASMMSDTQIDRLRLAERHAHDLAAYDRTFGDCRTASEYIEPGTLVRHGKEHK